MKKQEIIYKNRRYIVYHNGNRAYINVKTKNGKIGDVLFEEANFGASVVGFRLSPFCFSIRGFCVFVSSRLVRFCHIVICVVEAKEGAERFLPENGISSFQQT